MPDKPRTRSGYLRETTELVESACLTVAVTLGAFMDRLCIVGGLVPTLLIDRQLGVDADASDVHSGTNDLDIGLSIALLNDHQYTEISSRLRQEGFAPDRNLQNNPTPQRWKLNGLNLTIDFLLPPVPGDEEGGRVKNLQGDFAALIAPGLEVAFSEREEITLEGRTLKGELVRRSIPVCGPASFVVLKALAFADRGEPKDAYDLVYVLRRWPDGTSDIADRFASLTSRHAEVVHMALSRLANDFMSIDSIGPRRAAAFEGGTGDDLDAPAADAQGYVADLLRACRDRSVM